MRGTERETLQRPERADPRRTEKSKRGRGAVRWPSSAADNRRKLNRTPEVGASGPLAPSPGIRGLAEHVTTPASAAVGEGLLRANPCGSLARWRRWRTR